jgi:hypothetical protein
LIRFISTSPYLLPWAASQIFWCVEIQGLVARS